MKDRGKPVQYDPNDIWGKEHIQKVYHFLPRQVVGEKCETFLSAFKKGDFFITVKAVDLNADGPLPIIREMAIDYTDFEDLVNAIIDKRERENKNG